MPEYDAVTKISIVPRGNAGGLTFFAPSEERLESGLYSRTYLENQMCVALGGRIAEELIFGNDDITTGGCRVNAGCSCVPALLLTTGSNILHPFHLPQARLVTSSRLAARLA